MRTRLQMWRTPVKSPSSPTPPDASGWTPGTSTVTYPPNEAYMLYKQTLEDHFYSNIIKTGFHKTFRETRHSTGNQRQDHAHAKCSPKLLTREPPQKLVYRAHILETRYTVWPILVFRTHNYKCGEVIETLKLQKSRSPQCRTPAYLQLPVIELPAWRVVVS